MAKGRMSVGYIPDLQGLGDVCSETWEAWTTKEKSSNVVRVFHYLMFLEKTLRTAMLYIIYCMKLRLPVHNMWTDSWTLCETLDGMTIPKFLAEFLDSVGTFAGPNGSKFFWALPEALFEGDTYGFMGSKYMSSYPSFRVIRRLMRNLLDDRPTYLIPARHAPTYISNAVLWTEDKIRLLPGLRGALAAIGKLVSERVTNMQLEFEPRNNNYDSRFYFQQGDEDYFTYIDRIFDRCAEDGMPSTKLRLPRSYPKGGPMPLLVYYPDMEDENDSPPTRYYAMCDSSIAKLHIANLYRPTIKKQSMELMHKDEEDDRIDRELLSSTMAVVDTYAFRHYNRIYAQQFFI